MTCKLHDATDGVDASQFCDASNEVDNSNTPHDISKSDLQTVETAEEGITPSLELPDATNDAKDSEIRNATNKLTHVIFMKYTPPLGHCFELTLCI